MPAKSAAPNWANQTIWTADNLYVMRGMNSCSVDLIYLDPPFNSNANYAAPIGSPAAGAAFKDTWGLDDINLAWHGEIKSEQPGLYALLEATRSIHGNSMMSYLIYIAIRMMEMRRVLKDTGSIYLHCDPTASHYLKLMMDSVFGRKQFRNEIVWCYSGGGIPKKDFPRKHDVVLRYSKSKNWIYKPEYRPYGKHNTTGRRATDLDGTRKTEYRKEGTPITDWWVDVNPVINWSAEKTGYPTQKPLALLERIIQASSNQGEIVLDPFCGCATALVAAEKLSREWVGIDISDKAAELVELRLEKELGLFYDGSHRGDIPQRTDLVKLPAYNSPENKKLLYGEQSGFCNGCFTHFESRHLEVDHIIPQAGGGTHHISNLQLLCGSCNRIKGKKSQEELLVALTDKGYAKRQAELAATSAT